MATPEKLDLVGLRDIAVLLKVDSRTPAKWRQRGSEIGFPEEDGMISGTFPVWHKKRILAWAKATNRLPATDGSSPAPSQRGRQRETAPA